MNNDVSQYDLESALNRFSENLKKLIVDVKLNQKQFAEKMGVAESTLTGYVQGKKPPSIAFLISLKRQFKDVSIDRIFFDEIEIQSEHEMQLQEPISIPEIHKYKGTYYLYYLDTNKKTKKAISSENAHESIELKFGILYVSSKSSSNISATTCCIAVLGIKKREEAQKLKTEIDLLDNYEQICEWLRDNNLYGLYFGQFNMTQMHIFISLNRAIDAKDNALIILHHASMERDYYLGGLGTINSVSIGRDSDPIVQLIALSKNFAYVSEEQIKSQLRFSVPDIRAKRESEKTEILKIARSLYCSSNSSLEDASAYSQFNDHNKEMLLTSYLEYLILKNVENNTLWFGRVSSYNDADWYHLLKDSEAYHEKHEKGDEHEPAAFVSASNYSLH